MKKLTDYINNVITPPATLADVDPGVKSVLEDAVADYRSSQSGIAKDEVERRVQVGIATVWELVKLCESPIEKLIVPSLVFQPYGSNGPWIPADMLREGVQSFAPVKIAAQMVIDDARFDFMIGLNLGSETLMFAVECDGREFHDEARDFQRDRKWSRAGVSTVRLKGSDIHAAPRMAASRVAEFVLAQMIKRRLA